MRHSKHILTIQCLSTSNIRLYLFLAHCQAKALFMRAYHANGFFPHTHAMTTHAMFAPYKSRVVSRGCLLLPLTYLPGTSVGKKITLPGALIGKKITLSGRNYNFRCIKCCFLACFYASHRQQRLKTELTFSHRRSCRKLLDLSGPNVAHVCRFIWEWTSAKK